jgi:hypothetical protein
MERSPCAATPLEMAGVAEADDLEVVREIVFAQRGDAAGGRPEIDVTQ